MDDTTTAMDEMEAPMNDTFNEYPTPFGTPFNTVQTSLYFLIMVVGLVANGTLIISLVGQQGAGLNNQAGGSGRVHSRGPILLTLAIADFLVCVVSGPLTVCFTLLEDNPWPFGVGWCKTMFYLQSVPVTVSTFALVLVSVDRYVSVKCPDRVENLQDWIYEHCYTFAAVGAWFLGFITTSPILVLRDIPEDSGRCVEMWGSAEWRGCYVVVRLIVEHLVPSIMVLVCHLGVKRKLTALSLTARASHGDLPLPMPLLATSPEQVIIVAGLSNGDGKVMTFKPDNEESMELDNLDDIGPSTSKAVDPPTRKQKRHFNYTRRATKTEQELREENRQLRPPSVQPSSTLQSRRKMANALVSASVLFIGFWIPNMIYSVCTEVCNIPNPHMTRFSHISLLIAYTHSAINPLIYWLLNHKTLNNPCSTFSLLRSPGYVNASSTNEAALGPFHPRYAKPVAVRNMRRPSSANLC